MRTTAEIKDPIVRQVMAERVVAKDAIKLSNNIKPILEDFQGKKIYRADGNKTKAFQDALHINMDLFRDRHQRVFIERSYRSLYLTLSYWITFGKHLDSRGEYSHDDGAYYDIQVYLGEVSEDNKLTKIDISQEALQAKVDADLNHILQTREEIKQLQEKMNNLNSTIPYYARIR